MMKPVVKLLINRHNNKYSYTGASDDNILKNIELFDKLSLRFSNRVLFIKDVIGSSEICCWSFYGHGKKIAEVCCTAIVYATDRYGTVQYSTVQYSTVQYSTVQYSTVQYSTAQHSTAQYSTI